MDKSLGAEIQRELDMINEITIDFALIPGVDHLPRCSTPTPYPEVPLPPDDIDESRRFIQFCEDIMNIPLEPKLRGPLQTSEFIGGQLIMENLQNKTEPSTSTGVKTTCRQIKVDECCSSKNYRFIAVQGEDKNYLYRAIMLPNDFDSTKAEIRNNLDKSSGIEDDITTHITPEKCRLRFTEIQACNNQHKHENYQPSSSATLKIEKITDLCVNCEDRISELLNKKFSEDCCPFVELEEEERISPIPEQDGPSTSSRIIAVHVEGL